MIWLEVLSCIAMLAALILGEGCRRYNAAIGVAAVSVGLSASYQYVTGHPVIAGIWAGLLLYGGIAWWRVSR